MAVTRVYQIGEILFLEEDGNADRIKLRAWSVDSNADTVYIKNVLDVDVFQNYPKDIAIPLADVRDSTGAAIGGQTRKEVEDWCAYPVA